MNEYPMLILAAGAGAVLGVIFFGGLWWTVRQGMTSSHPARWFFTSLLLRMGIAVTGFYWVGNGDWRRLMACLVGFLVARVIVTRLTRLPTELNQLPSRDPGNAS